MVIENNILKMFFKMAEINYNIKFLYMYALYDIKTSKLEKK